MDLEKRLPIPVVIPLSVVVGGIIGGVGAALLVSRRRSHAEGELVGHTPSVADFVRFGFAALALIRIAAEFLGKEKDKDKKA
ncbi:MAG: hypothetical protein H6649_11260 [Caldilineae bacterium]|nr:hypothetical protein [Anaerolineae bacterium]MCB9154613.1 hypothetical protein [Caldilineae bacterium]